MDIVAPVGRVGSAGAVRAKGEGEGRVVRAVRGGRGQVLLLERACEERISWSQRGDSKQELAGCPGVDDGLVRMHNLGVVSDPAHVAEPGFGVQKEVRQVRCR